MRTIRYNTLSMVCLLSLYFGNLSLAQETQAVTDDFNLSALLSQREPNTMLAPLKQKMLDKVELAWNQQIMADAQAAYQRNQANLYPNPSLQVYINRLGQSLLPQEAPESALVSFKIVEDPLPYTDTLATGTVFISSGLVSIIDNESQLAFLMMQEAAHVLLSHHLHQTLVEEKEERKKRRWRTFTMGLSNFFIGAPGQAGQGILGSFRALRFEKGLQNETDSFAIETLLRNQYDPREATVMMAKVYDIISKSNAAVDLAFNYTKDLPERSARITRLLNGKYAERITEVLKGDGFVIASPLFNQLLAEVKRDNGSLALTMDLFVLARTNLEEAANTLTDDCMTYYNLGLYYRAVARTAEERENAAGYFQKAIKADVHRHRFPRAHLEYAVELLGAEKAQHYPEIRQALKNYVILHQRQNGGRLPREMNFIYDYLDKTGDPNWKAYPVTNMSTTAPFQFTGDEVWDKTLEQPAKGSK